MHKLISRSVNSALLAILILILIALPVLAVVAYSAPLQIVESGSNAYTMLPVSVTSPNTWLANNNYMKTTALDTRVATGAGLALPHLVVNDRTLTASAVPANSNVNLNFTTGNSDLTSMDIITGYNGYFTVADAAALEPGNNFATEMDGYILYQSVHTPMLYKDGAIGILAESTGAVSAATGTPAAGISQALDDTNYSMFGATWAAQTFTVGGSAIYVSQVTLRLARNNNPAGNLTVSLRATSGGDPTGTDLVSSSVSAGSIAVAATTYTFYFITRLEAATVYSIVVRVPTGDAGNSIYLRYRAADVLAGGELKSSADSGATWAGTGGDARFEVYNYPLVVRQAGVAAGEHNIQVTADTVDLKLYIDTVEEDTTALGGDSVQNTTADWIAMSNATPYLNYFKHTVGGTLITHYQPVTMITGVAYSTGTVTVTNGDATVVGAGGASWTDNMAGSIFVSADGVWYVVSSVTNATELELTSVYGGGTLGGQAYNFYPRLPDREGAAQNGTITWGANPAGVAVTLGSMVAVDQTVPGVTTERATRDLLPTAPVSDWFQEPDVSGALLTNPLRPFVTIMSDSTSLTESQAWTFLGLVFVLIVTVGIGSRVRGHHLITGAGAAASVVTLVVMSIWPLWALVFAAVAIIGGLVSERSPSL